MTLYLMVLLTFDTRPSADRWLGGVFTLALSLEGKVVQADILLILETLDPPSHY